MRESLVDKDLILSTESERPVVRMLPDVQVVKIGGRSLVDQGRDALFPVIDVIAEALTQNRLILGTGGGVRSRHVMAIGMDLGLPTGVLAQVAIADALGNAHILGTLLAPHGVVAIPPEIFGHLLPFFMKAAPGVIFNGNPPYSLWEHPPGIGRIPPHRTDAGCYLVGECFGCERVILVKDVDGLYEADPKIDPNAILIKQASVAELRDRRAKGGLKTLPFDEVMIDLLERARLVKSFRVVNGLDPDQVRAAIAGEEVGSLIHA
jgi:molybdenum storage protein